jgi:hypothetical protein
MSRLELKKIKSKIINELNTNTMRGENISNIKIIPMIDIVEMENMFKTKKLEYSNNLKKETPDYLKKIPSFTEINKDKEDEIKREFNKVLNILFAINTYTRMNEVEYEKLDKMYKQVDEDVKSNKFDVQWVFSEIEKNTNVKLNNLSEAFMQLKLAARIKNKKMMTNILKNQPEILNMFLIATKNN